jgi:hypothetical protein
MNRIRTRFHPATIGAYATILALVAVSSMSTAEARHHHFSMAEARAACTGDAMRLCSQYIPSRARIAACLRHNSGSLSPGCHHVLAG